MLAMTLWELTQVLRAWLRCEGNLCDLLVAWWQVVSGQAPLGD